MMLSNSSLSINSVGDIEHSLNLQNWWKIVNWFTKNELKNLFKKSPKFFLELIEKKYWLKIKWYLGIKEIWWEIWGKIRLMDGRVVPFKWDKLYEKIEWKIIYCLNVIEIWWEIWGDVKLMDGRVVPFKWDKLYEEIEWKKIVCCFNIKEIDWEIWGQASLENWNYVIFKWNKILK